MLVIVSYDVSTATADGERRLRRVAKACLNHGQRVQNSVFECLLENDQWVRFRSELLKLADLQHDSLRFYRLNEPVELHVREYGKFKAVDFEGPLVL